MLSDQLSHLLEQASEYPTTSPNFTEILAEARRRRHRRRLTAVGAVATLGAVGVVAAVTVVGGLGQGATHQRLGAASGSPIPLPASLTLHTFPVSISNPVGDQTCEVLTFTETGSHFPVECVADRHDGSVEIDGFRYIRVRSGSTPDFIADGLVTTASGTVTVTDNAGNQIPASILQPLPGFHSAVFYADLGPTFRRPTLATFTGSKGQTSVDQPPVPFATPAPPASSPN
jgi:hypothetical protein